MSGKTVGDRDGDREARPRDNIEGATSSSIKTGTAHNQWSCPQSTVSDCELGHALS